MPERIQLRRKKGWRRPPNTVNVARPAKWGNPFVVGRTTPANWTRHGAVYVRDRAHAVQLYRELMADSPARCAEAREQLRGKDLACWCPPGEPCHADVLLEIANRP